MKHSLWLASILLTLSFSTAPKSGVTGTSADGQPLTVTIVPVQQDNLSTNKLLVTRGDATFWLRSSNTLSRFGCDIKVAAQNGWPEALSELKLAWQRRRE